VGEQDSPGRNPEYSISSSLSSWAAQRNVRSGQWGVILRINNFGNHIRGRCYQTVKTTVSHHNSALVDITEFIGEICCDTTSSKFVLKVLPELHFRYMSARVLATSVVVGLVSIAGLPWSVRRPQVPAYRKVVEGPLACTGLLASR
jgi:hypothetical protein